MKSILICIALIICFAGNSEAQVIHYTDSSRIMIRWNGAHYPLPQGTFIYKKTNGGEWEKMNRRAVKPEFGNKELQKILGYKKTAYLQLFGIKDAGSDLNQAAWDSTYAKKGAEAFIGALSLVNPEYAAALGELYEDKDVVPGYEYQYKIIAEYGTGTKEFGISANIICGKKNIPKSVSELTAECGDGFALLKWKKEKSMLSTGEVVTWQIERSTDILGPYEIVNYYGVLPVSAGEKSDESYQTYKVSFLENNREYFFRVIAVNAFGISGSRGITVQCTPAFANESNKPFGLEVTRNGKSAKLTWQNQSVAIYSSVNGGAFERVFPPAGLAYTSYQLWYDTDIQEGENRQYFLKALHGRGEEGVSGDTVQFFMPDETAPATPLDIIAVVKNGIVTLTWQKCAEIDVLGYHLERSSDDIGSRYFLLNSSPLPNNKFTDTIHASATTVFRYRVAAIDKSYNQSNWSVPVVVRFPDKNPPVAPLITKLIQTVDGIEIHWQNGPEKDILYNRIYIGLQGSVGLKGNEVSGTTFIYPIGKKGIYEVSVTAVDTARNESEKSSAKIITILSDWNLPVPANGIADTSGNRIRLSWTEPAGSFEGYMISRISEGKRYDIGNTKNTSFTDTRPPKGQHRYEIRTYNSEWQTSPPLIILVHIR